MRRFAAVLTVGIVAATVTVAAPAGALAGEATPEPISIEYPGRTLIYEQDPGTVDPRPDPERHDPASIAGAQARTATPAASAFVAPPNQDFVFRYESAVSTQKRAAFEAAAGIWSQVLEVEVPIQVGVDVESFADPGILGGAAPGDLFANDAAFPLIDTWYVSAHANQFAGRDLDPEREEISVVISSDYDFYEGVDGNVPPDQISLLALALHELAHGLGHTTLAQHYPDGTGSVRYPAGGSGLPMAFDLLVQTRAGTPLTRLSRSELGRALAQPTRWGGPEGRRINGGTPPVMYSPTLFQTGSSLSHIDEKTYTTALLTPFLAGGEAQTEVPALSQAMFADFGWGLEARTRSEAFVTAISRDFVKRFPTPTEMRTFSSRLDRRITTRHELARTYGLSDEWVGAMVDAYYLVTLDRPADPAGKSHWSAKLRGGMTSADVVSRFFASPEYFARSGGTNRAWVRSLYVGILGRQPDAAGWAAWTDAADRGTPLTVIAASIYQAPESRAKRVTDLYRSLLGRQPDPAGLAHWTDVLRNGHDIQLAITLASSPEYDNRATTRYG